MKKLLTVALNALTVFLPGAYVFSVQSGVIRACMKPGPITIGPSSAPCPRRRIWLWLTIFRTTLTDRKLDLMVT